jgi:AcrR family transcriptional regulator
MQGNLPSTDKEIVLKTRKPDPRIARTRQLLGQSLRQLLADQCFEDIRIQDILDKSTMNRATFYAHFDDKDALLLFILRNIFEECLQERVPADAPALPQHLDQLIFAVCDFLGKVRRCSKLSTIEGNPHVEAAMKPGVHKIIAGWLRPMDRGTDFDHEMAAATASWIICGAAVRWNKWNRTETPISAQEFLEKLHPLLAPSVASIMDPAAREFSKKPVLAYAYFGDEVGLI